MRLQRVRNAFSFPRRSDLREFEFVPLPAILATADMSWIRCVSFSRKGPEFLERVGGLAAGLSVKNQQMLSTGMGHIEAVSVEIKLANLGVAHVDDAGAVADIRARPQLAEALTGS